MWLRDEETWRKCGLRARSPRRERDPHDCGRFLEWRRKFAAPMPQKNSFAAVQHGSLECPDWPSATLDGAAMNRKGNASNDRDQFERILQDARLKRAAFLGEALAGFSRAVWKRATAWWGRREEGGALAAG
jgi:hypothetical protein